jgi:hypothetical protein
MAAIQSTDAMSEDQVDELARAFADATGITVDEARTALEDQESTMVRMARAVRLSRSPWNLMVAVGDQ